MDATEDAFAGILPRLAGRNLIQAAKLVQTTANLSPLPLQAS
jgi:hypothetical protein